MTHHAYLLEGPLSLLAQLADDACERFEFERHPSTSLGAGNPDVVVEHWEKFGIDEARALSQRASLKSTSGRSLFVLGISTITSEAQQALLKLFEEPVVGAMFVLLVPHGTLLPTLRSRFMAYPGALEGKKGASDAKEFLGSTYARRSAWITEFLKDEERDLREEARVFLNGLEAELHKKIGTSGEVRGALQDIAHFRQYLSDRAPSLKMILEHIAAVTPKI